MKTKNFRAELVKIMPGFSWTVHKPLKTRLPSHLADGLPDVLTATGIRSSGSNRLSTLEVERRDSDGQVTYTARSSGYGAHAPWLHCHKDHTLARALRGLQTHYEVMASKYSSHAGALKVGRQDAEQEGGAA